MMKEAQVHAEALAFMQELSSLTSKRTSDDAASARVVCCCEAAAQKAANSAYRLEILTRGCIASLVNVLAAYMWSADAIIALSQLIAALAPEPLAAGAKWL